MIIKNVISLRMEGDFGMGFGVMVSIIIPIGTSSVIFTEAHYVIA